MQKIENLSQVLRKAHQGRYAVGSFSPRYTKLILPIIEAAIETNSPVIVQISEKEVYRHEVDLKDFAQEFFRVTQELKPSIPMVLHLDHTKDFEIIKQAIAQGFTSVMIDASEYDFDRNVELSKQIVAYAHPYNVTVEAELGKIGTTDFAETDHDEELYTVPEEAQKFLGLTKADALAVSVGTAHGIYTVRQPKIDYNRLQRINELTQVPLVLHGGSGVPSDMVVKAAQMEKGGVSKVNIATDVEQAMLKVVGKNSFMTEKELNSYPEEVLSKAREAVKELVKEKIKNYLLSEGKANH
ncbi:MAG TPA: class II fructose-bisphosphate aldolase [Clostridiales bacterium]|nr:class II fructose-bisphosphate aldolase [Clostridiales bacterium]